MSENLLAGLREWMAKCLGVDVQDNRQLTDPKLIVGLLQPMYIPLTRNPKLFNAQTFDVGEDSSPLASDRESDLRLLASMLESHLDQVIYGDPGDFWSW
jgi:hypothetical protein